ncbi:class I SAM-dependent methyltransferase [Polyangium sorediatum]|uniref:Class I SAM-dependent methyltransferase n=1 Tax=Polyangium sorediatum TaxID=889274 RepID=A0ABT6P0E0_9BACT|nr:class I SAM-dependent methyltransferase [Polyangium sorediatum]MDI1434070.1 class I SAM-dependent methyltransferase [Polyangium sorediatum]
MRPSLCLLLLPVIACASEPPPKPVYSTTETMPHDELVAKMTPTKPHHGHGDGHHAHGEGHHGHGGPLVHRFEKAEDWAKEFDDPARDAWQKPAEVVAAMRISPGMIVADIGAGTGYFEPHLARAVGPSGKVHALDVEADMVRYLRERAQKEKLDNVEARQVGLSDPGLGQGTVDRVLIVDTWHHIDGRKDYAAKVKDGLKPGGLLIIVDFTMEAPKGPPKEHRITPEAMIAELGAAGLKGEVVQETLPDQYIVVAKKP